MNYSGFWRRFLGTFVDCMILFALSMVINRMIPYIGWIISLSFGFLYYPVFWSSTARATPGKYLIGTVVVDIHGQRITFRMAMIRYLCSWVSGVFLGFGYLIALFTEKKQTFHDLLAGTYVIDDEVIVEEGLYQSWLNQLKSLRE